MSHLKYGTPEYYAECFGDILADVEGENPATADAILEGFYKAIDEWFDYHDAQSRAYAELRKRVHQALAV